MPLTTFARLTAAAALAFSAQATAQTGAPDPDPYADARAVMAGVNEIVTPDGIQELMTVELGGMEQWISIRGTDRGNPVLLFLHGGPGAPEMAVGWAFQRPWEDYFTVVQWDQRGGGKTFRHNGVAASREGLSRERIVADTVELMAWLREHLGQERIIVVGHSWGTVAGFQAAMARPDWVHAYVGIGQIVDMDENERRSHALTLAAARADGNAEAIADLTAIAPYPGDTPVTFERIGAEREWAVHYGGLAAYRDNAGFYYRARRLAPEYEQADREAVNPGGIMSVTTLLDDLMAVRQGDVEQVDFPVVFFAGRHDLTTPSDLVEAWYRRLEAPSKELVWFEHSAHLSPIEEPGRTLVALVQHVLPLTQNGEAGDAAR
ncbi:alpha/beta fold hydrolase [Maricaulis virginensis]|uniref:Proline iminopeptidase n=1 Tax=Maricaulis virginensis TaxID=144022 RepID=A0A9W6MN42_9PROT|nr:alpha/beta hydrolase [Maricaulis virginensis]GLK51643.1 proline iminopeptidase [Maricaulis virginensis]